MQLQPVTHKGVVIPDVYAETKVSDRHHAALYMKPDSGKCLLGLS